MRISQTTGIPLKWTESQCAAYRGVPRQQWLSDVQEGLEPPPITTYRTLIDPVEDGQISLWDAAQVRRWKRPDEWFAGECGAHHGISAATWTACVRHGAAPDAVRTVRGRRIWRKSDVRKTHLNIKPKADRTPRTPKTFAGPDPDAEGWTAKECADYLGIAPRAWRAAVRAGDAPQPSGTTKGRTPVWSPKTVQDWGDNATGN